MSPYYVNSDKSDLLSIYTINAAIQSRLVELILSYSQPTIKITHKNSSPISRWGVILNIEFYFNISPASDTLCWGYGIDIFLFVLNRQCKLSEFQSEIISRQSLPWVWRTNRGIQSIVVPLINYYLCIFSRLKHLKGGQWYLPYCF